MKRFEDICRMTQTEVKEYMKQYLTSKEYEPVCEDGFLYAKGTIPVLLVAHMDTVHKKQCEEIVTLNGVLSSPQGIGGDDRCGIFMIANIVKDLHCSVLLCEDEEIGMVGAKKFCVSKYIDQLDVNYMIELDRKGVDDAVFYSCANEEFIKFVLDATGNTKAWGSFSDISTLMPITKLCGVNLSCGYFNAHTTSEYVNYKVMTDAILTAKCLIETECDKPFEYMQQRFSYYDDTNDDDGYRYSSYQDVSSRIAKDTHLELEAYVYTATGKEKVYYASGETKMECWFDLLTTNPHICIDDIVDYNFM